MTFVIATNPTESNFFTALIKIAVLGALVILGGCTSTVGKSFSNAEVEKFTVGTTQKSEVEQALGKPYQQIIGTTGVERWVYLFRSSSDNMALVKVLPISNLIGGAMPDVKVKQKILELRFKADIVSDCKLSVFEGAAPGKPGRAIGATSNLESGKIREFACGQRM